MPLPKIESSAVGREFAPHEREVTWRDITNYAAAVGDTNPRYVDDSRQGGIVAHLRYNRFSCAWGDGRHGPCY